MRSCECPQASGARESRPSILLTGAGNSLNNGVMAMTLGLAVRLLEESVVSAATVLTPTPEVDRERYHPYGIAVVAETWYSAGRMSAGMPRVLKAVTLMARQLVMAFGMRLGLGPPADGFLRVLAQASAVVDVSGDSLSDCYGSKSCLLRLYPLLLCMIAGKPYFIMGQTIGPFTSPLSLIVARVVLARARLVTAREGITVKYLSRLAPRLEVHQTADLAYMLRPAALRDVETVWREEAIPSEVGGPLVGICPSSIVTRWFRDGDTPDARQLYVACMASLTDHLVKRYGAAVLLIPSVRLPKFDDLAVCEAVARQTDSTSVYVVRGRYAADTLKAVIGRCEIVVSSRMHPAILAVSQGIPCVALAYSQKVPGVLGDMLGLADYVVDIRGLTSAQLSSKLVATVDELWSNARQIRDGLRRLQPELVAKAEENVALLKAHLGW